MGIDTKQFGPNEMNSDFQKSEFNSNHLRISALEGPESTSISTILIITQLSNMTRSQ